MRTDVLAAEVVANLKLRGIRIVTDGYTLAIEPARDVLPPEKVMLRVLRPLVIAVLKRLPVDERGAELVAGMAIQRARQESSWAIRRPALQIETK